MEFSFMPLGISAAVPFNNRHLAAHILQIHSELLLIDCGEGTLFQLQKFKVKYHNINHIFISHLHGDHFFGLAGVLTTFSITSRKNPIHIYSPTGLEDIIRTIFKYSGFVSPYPLIFHTVDTTSTSILIDNSFFFAKSFPLFHRIPTIGFYFQEKPLPLNLRVEAITTFSIPFNKLNGIKAGANYFHSKSNSVIPNSELTLPPLKWRSFAYCSDTIFSPQIVENIEDVDILYHESTFLHEMAAHARASGHSTALEAAQIALLANAQKLIIGHFSARYSDLTVLSGEARTIFENTELAEEGVATKVAQMRTDRRPIKN